MFSGKDTMENKLDALKENLREMGNVMIAFSGGTDYSFLASVAFEVLGERALAVPAVSAIMSEREKGEAVETAVEIGLPHVLFETDQLEYEGFQENIGKRCYFCRVDLFSKMVEMAKKRDIRWVLDGTIVDDLGDHRPGLKARNEWEVKSPLVDVGLTKEDIRVLSRERKLSTWDKPQEACLASRIPWGTKVTFELLDVIDKAEEYLFALGFEQVRVRHHGKIARIELGKDEIARFLEQDLKDDVVARLLSLGYQHVTLDLMGYQTGSMNVVDQRVDNKPTSGV